MRLNQAPMHLFSLVLMLSLTAGILYAEENRDRNEGNRVSRTQVASSAMLDINQIGCWVLNDGGFGTTPDAGTDGFYYPRWQRTLSIIYTAGLWFLGKVDGEIRTAVNCYGSEFRPGTILAPDTPDDHLLEKYKVYKYNIGDVIKQDAIDQGCPEELVGDQMCFSVYNDIMSHENMWRTPYLGLEVQHLTFGFNRTGALGMTVFQRYRLVNKSSTDIEDAYVAMFFDPDLGFANDDYTGCDPRLGIGYVYNGDGYDEKYGVRVPALGCDFLQGPVVPSSGETAVLPDGSEISDSKILGMTAFFTYVGGSPIPGMQDPDAGGGTAPQEAYYFCQGLLGNGDPWMDPSSGTPTPTSFPFAGDPVEETGWLLSSIIKPNDVRMGMSSGPFNLSAGESQDVYVGLVVGEGANNLNSITVMKYYDKAVQFAYDLNFELPKPPPVIQVEAAELDEEIVLMWDDAGISFNEADYLFEGFNVWEGERIGGPWHRLATFDLVNNITVIMDEGYNSSAGTVVNQVVQSGEDSGLRFRFHVENSVLSQEPLVNGRPYYFAVTAYAYNPQGVPRCLEHGKGAIEVIPQRPVLDTEYNSEVGDGIDVTHTGNSTGSVSVTVVDPASVTGHDYEVRFEVVDDTLDAHDGETLWKLVDVNTNEVKLSSFNQSAATGNVVVDGFEIVLTGDAGGYYDWDIPSGSRMFTWAGGADGYWLQAFEGALTWESPATWWGSGYQYPVLELKSTLLKLANVQPDGTFDPNDENVSYGYRYLRGASSAPARPEFAPFIINPSGGTYPFQDYTKSVPISAWDVSNPASPRRLQVGHLENNQPGGMVDGKYWPPYYGDASNTDGGGPREWLWIFDEDYSETPNPDYQVPIATVDAPIMWWATWARRNTDEWSAAGTGTDQFIIICKAPHTPDDVFAFSTAGYEKSKTADVAKERLDDINVFPNPYFGHNTAEGDYYSQFVTFNNLPEECTLRIFSLSGSLVRVFKHTNGTPFERWDLETGSGRPVASGIFIVHVQTEFGNKILKLAVLNRQIVYKHL